MQEAREPNGDHERTDARAGPIVMFTLGLSLLVALTFLGVSWLQESLLARAARADAPSHPMADARALPPEPRLQATPALDIEAYRSAQAAVAESYDWIDRDAGVVRIPIDRAFERVLEEGLPSR